MRIKPEYNVEKRIKELSGGDTTKKVKSGFKRPKKKKETVKKLTHDLDEVFARFIKLRDTDENGHGNCCTCNKYLQWVYDEVNDNGKNKTNRNAQCGHFMGRGKNNTRWHEQNCSMQCGMPCNDKRIGGGKPYEFSVFIDKKYGENTAAMLKTISEVSRKPGLPWLREQIVEYKGKVKYLLIDKNFEL